MTPNTVLASSAFGCAFAEDFVRGADETVHVVVEVAPGIDSHGVAIGEITDVFGKLARLRHSGPTNQQRDDE